jgi:predicted transcriptional regulator
MPIMDSIEAVRNLETQLVATRKEVAKELRTTRESLGLSLRKVANGVRMTQGAVYNIEVAKSWKTRTVEKIARYYERQSAA